MSPPANDDEPSNNTKTSAFIPQIQDPGPTELGIRDQIIHVRSTHF